MTNTKRKGRPVNCEQCGRVIIQTEFGNWVHEILGVTYCASQFPATLYNNWDKRVARPVSA